MANEKQIDLIDRNELLEKLRKNRKPGYGYATATVGEMPTVNAVCVIHCKECEKGHPELAPNGGVWCAKWNHIFGYDEFCSKAEKKEA